MSITVDLTPNEQRRVENARDRGIDVAALLKGIISALPDPADAESAPPPGSRTLALLAQWAEEDATDDPEELERRDRENAEFFSNLKTNRLTLPIPKV